MRTITTFSELMQIVETTTNVFIRWSSDINQDIRRGYSVNHQTGAREAGLSVNGLHNDVLRGAAYVAMQLLEYSYLRVGTNNVEPYMVRGDICGTGSDGELVIANMQVVARISEAVLDEAKAIRTEERTGKIAYWYTELSSRLTGRDLRREVARRAQCWSEDVQAWEQSQ